MLKIQPAMIRVDQKTARPPRAAYSSPLCPLALAGSMGLSGSAAALFEGAPQKQITARNYCGATIPNCDAAIKRQADSVSSRTEKNLEANSKSGFITRVCCNIP